MFMKTVFASVFALLLWGATLPALSQSCATCKSYKFKYFGCRNGVRVTECTDDPWNVPNFRPIKICPNATIIVDKPPTDLKKEYFWDENGDNVMQSGEDIFRWDHAETQATVGAVVKWQAACGNIIDNTNCYNCPIRVRWARRKEDMRGSVATAISIPHKFLNGCSTMDCSTSEIWVNMTNEYCNYNFKSKEPLTFFYTNKTGYVKTENPYQYWYDFSTVITHELGHRYGFQHQDESCTGPGADDMMMRGIGIEPLKEWDITFLDKCMFMKVYCCPTTSPVEEEFAGTSISEDNITLVPNPTTGLIKVLFPESSITKQRRSVRVFSILGREVHHGLYDGDTKYITLDLSNLPIGIYKVVIDNGGRLQSGTIVIE
jgi:hypothetical protein